MASGVYPYITEAGQSVTEWTESNVQPLLDKYNAYLTSIGKSYQITLQGGAPTIRGFLQQGAIVIANDVWGKLREFVQWIQSEYALTDNQTGVELSSLPDNISYVPFVPAENILPKSSLLQTSQNIFFGIRGGDTSLPRVKVCRGYAERGWQYANLVFGVVSDNSYPGAVVEYRTRRNDYGNVIDPDNAELSTNWGSLRYRNSDYPSVVYFALGGQAPDEALSFGAVPSFDTVADTMAFLGGQSAEGTSAVTVDTTTVMPLDALPADTPWGGLAVEGAGDVSSPTVVEGVIAEAIEQREKPAVQPVVITVSPGTEIDPETGETDPPVVITPFPPSNPMDLELGEALLNALEEHFPFSIPWDLYKIFSRLDAQPVAPRFTVTTPALSGFAPVSFTIDVATTPFNTFAPIFRAFVGILLALGLLIGASRWIKR